MTPQQARRKREARRLRDRKPLEEATKIKLLRLLAEDEAAQEAFGLELTEVGSRILASEDAADLRRTREAAGQGVLAW